MQYMQKMQKSNKGINYVDVCCGLAWGDEAKGKIIADLSKINKYDYVCRWAGGNNAGHTIYKNAQKYKTHLIPCGIFYNITSVIGPDCVINVKSFLEEVKYLRENGFNTELIKISPKAHVILDKHIEYDKSYLLKSQGTTSKGIAPCYCDKYKRVGILAVSIPEFKSYIWDEKLEGNILCEGAQGFWLDINNGNYPFVTSSTTLPYGACSLGFPPQKIRNIYGAAKIYDTRSGIDPFFPEELFDNEELQQIIDVGKEYGTTTGRKRKVNWLNLNKLIEAINISGTTDLIISKGDVLEEVNIYKVYYNEELLILSNIDELKLFISNTLTHECSSILQNIIYSNSPYKI
jgi:adenylosuccinate synthase